MTVPQDSAESTPRPYPSDVKTNHDDPRNMNMNGESVCQCQGIEHGCPARIGAFVMDGDGPEGIITGLTDQLVIFKDKHGHEFAQRYGFCTTPLAPPNFTGPVGEAPQTTPGASPGASPATFPELRGERSACGMEISNLDARYGVPVPLGTLVFAPHGEGVVIGGTDQLCIVRDEDGREFCDRWGVVQVQASGPAFDVTDNKPAK